VGANVNITRAVGNQHESTISVNPTNPKQLFVAGNQELQMAGLFFESSSDGGATWTGGLRATGPNGDGLPEACCDPQSAWDSFGNLFLTYLGDNQDIELLLSTDGGQTFSDIFTFTDNNGSGPDQPSIAVGAGSIWI